MTVRFFVRYFS